jgi:hypothetical protein
MQIGVFACIFKAFLRVLNFRPKNSDSAYPCIGMPRNVPPYYTRHYTRDGIHVGS